MKLKLFLSLLFSAALFISCSDEQITGAKTETTDVVVAQLSKDKVTLREGTFVFPTQEGFDEFAKKLGDDPQFRIEIEKKFGSHLLASKADNHEVDQTSSSLINNVPYTFRYILSNDGAYVIGDKYIKYGSSGMVYFVDLKAKDQFDWANEKSLVGAGITTYKYGRVKPENKVQASNARMETWTFQSAMGGQQHEFVQQTPNVGNKKWVDEWNTFYTPITSTIQGTPRYKCTIQFYVKLYWKGSGSYKPASEYRYITPNGTFTLEFARNPSAVTTVCTNCKFAYPPCCVTTQTPTLYQNTDFVYTNSYDYNEYAANPVGNCKWYITGSANVVHRVDGDVPGNTWTSSLVW